MAIRIRAEYSNRDPLTIFTEDFQTTSEAKDRIANDPAMQVFLGGQGQGGGHLLSKSGLTNLTLQKVNKNGKVVIEENIKFKDGEVMAEEQQQPKPEETKEEPKKEAIEPEVLPPEDKSEQSFLPDLPERYNSFRDRFFEYRRNQQSWMDEIVRKMQTREEKLRAADSLLNRQNEELDEFITKELGGK